MGDNVNYVKHVIIREDIIEISHYALVFLQPFPKLMVFFNALSL